MDCRKVGNLLLTLRKEKKMTQKQVADALNISDKTVSKWERGLGCPDVSLLKELSEVFQVSTEKILCEYSVTFSHEMTKEHYLLFAAYVCSDKMYFVKLYPEQDAHLRIPMLYRGELYVYCTKHGLKVGKIK